MSRPRPRGAALCGEPSRTLPQVVRARAGAELVGPRGRTVEVVPRRREIPALRVVVGKSLEVVVERALVDLLDRRGHRAVELSTAGGERTAPPPWRSPCRNPHTNSG